MHASSAENTLEHKLELATYTISWASTNNKHATRSVNNVEQNQKLAKHKMEPAKHKSAKQKKHSW
jgi:hypothetical protein